MDFVKSEGSNTQAAILIRGSSIIAEYYADNFDKNSVVTSWSVAKSFTSTLIGIAIDEGYINSIETLFLHSAGHVRAKYIYENGTFHGEWLVP